MNEHLILKNFLFFSKCISFNARTTFYLNISHLLIYIKGIKDTEKKLYGNNVKKKKKVFFKKCKLTEAK